MKKSTVKKKVNLGLLAETYVRALEVGKESYDRARETFAVLLQHAQPGDEIPLANGEVLVIVDQFEHKNIVWKPAGVERFVGQVRRATDVTKKL